MKIDALLFWANTQDNIQCPLCPEIIAPGEAIDWDHAIPLGLGGEHHYTNIRPLHRACHHRKTFGSKATSAGSDVHRIAKVKRIQRKIAGTWKKTKKIWPSRHHRWRSPPRPRAHQGR